MPARVSCLHCERRIYNLGFQLFTNSRGLVSSLILFKPHLGELTSDKRKDSQRHHQNGDHKIRDGQAHQEIISNVLQPPLPDNRQAYQDIPRGRSQDQDERQHRPPIVEVLRAVLASAGARTRRLQVDLAGIRGSDVPQGQRVIIRIRQDDLHSRRTRHRSVKTLIYRDAHFHGMRGRRI